MSHRKSDWGIPCSQKITQSSASSTTERASLRRLTSARDVLELPEVDRLRTFETALGEHLKHGFDALGVIKAAERDEDHSREALQVGGEHPGAAFGAEVSV